MMVEAFEGSSFWGKGRLIWKQRSLKSIAVLLASLSILSCNQQTQDLYKVEVERKCHNCNLQGVDLSNQSLGSKYRISVSSQPLSTQPKGLGYAQPVDLTGSDLRDANLRSTNLEGVILTRTQLENADLREANLKNAQLVGANLAHADLRGANLQGANFQGTNLTNTDLRDTDLTSATFERANLADAMVDNAP